MKQDVAVIFSRATAGLLKPRGFKWSWGNRWRHG